MSSNDEKKFFGNFPREMKGITTALTGNEENWKERYKALEDLERIVQEGNAYETFPVKFSKYHDDLTVLLEKQMKDLRSEIVRQASATIGTLARELTNSFQKMARKLMPTLIDISSARNGTIRGYAQKCVNNVVQSVQSKGILFIITDMIHTTKSSVTSDCCMEFFRTALAFWPMKEKYVEHIELLEGAILTGLQNASPVTRTLAVKCFWLYVGQFNERRELFLSSFHPKVRRLVEKGKTIEEEQQEYEAATKIAAVVKSHLTRKKLKNSFHASQIIDVGVRVKTEHGQSGVIRYIGELRGKAGEWIGIETDDAADSNGNGLVGGVKYFDCKPKHAMFVRRADVKPEDDNAVFAAVGSTLAVETARQPSTSQTSDTASISSPRSPTKIIDDDINEFKDPSFPKAPQFPRSRSSTLDDKQDWDAEVQASTSGPTPLGAFFQQQQRMQADIRKLSASGKQLELEAAIAAHSPDMGPRNVHNRGLSIPGLNDHGELVKEHKFHLSLMGEIFQTEVDLLQKEEQDPNIEEYVGAMVMLLDELSKRSLFLKAKFLDYQRKLKNLDNVHDEFLNQNDKFTKL